MISDTVVISIVGGVVSLLNTILLIKLKKNTDGMQETIRELADARGQLIGAAQVRSDMQAGADSPLILPTPHAIPPTTKGN